MENMRSTLEIIDLIAKSGRFFHYKMGSGRYRLLSDLLNNGNSMTQKELQEKLCIKSGSISEIIGKIAQDELLERKRSPKDGRQIMLCLTEEGVVRAKHIRDEYEKNAEHIFSCFTENEKKQLLCLLEKLYNNIHEGFEK